MLVRCTKQLKTSSGDLGWRFKKCDQDPQFRKNRLPSNFNVEIEVEGRYKLHKYLNVIVTNIHGFPNHIARVYNSLIQERYNGLKFCRNFDWRVNGGNPDITLSPHVNTFSENAI